MCNLAQVIEPGQPLFRPECATAPIDLSRLGIYRPSTSYQSATMSADTLRILACVQDNPRCSFKLIRTKCRLGGPKVGASMHELFDHGYVSRTGYEKHYLYSITRKGTAVAGRG